MAVKKRLGLDLRDIDSKNKQKAKKEIVDLIIDATLEAVSQGKSPVKGEKPWKPLSKEYADKEKNGDRTPNMELTGDMLDALTGKISGPDRNYVTIEISGSESEKAESHNHHNGKGTNPRRRFIPFEEQEYKTDIQREIKRIEDKYRKKNERQKKAQQDEKPKRSEVTSETGRGSIDFTLNNDDFTGNTNLVDNLLAQLDGR